MKLLSKTMIGGNSDNYKRSDSDFYETPKEATIALLNEIRPHIKKYIDRGWEKEKGVIKFLEPCCGNGAISKILQEEDFPFVLTKVESVDIRLTDFCSCPTDYLLTPFSADVIITNPPFNLAEKFIRKATKEAPIVAMLLKSQYWNTKARIDLFNERTPYAIYPLTWRPAMSPERGSAPTMDFQWTVWCGHDNDFTVFKPLPKP